MRAQAQEIERLLMELQRTSIKQKESIPELAPGALEEFVQEDRVAQWMRPCVRALRIFLDHTGLPLQRPLDHEGANDQPPPPFRLCAPEARVRHVLTCQGMSARQGHDLQGKG